MNTLSQRLQDYFEQYHGLCLQASEWDYAALNLKTAEDKLLDPNAVHTNMLAGRIAKPSPEQIWHIYGVELVAAMPTPYTAGLVEALEDELRDSSSLLPVRRGLIRQAAAALTAQAAEIARLKAFVADAGDQFAFYAENHRAKGTGDGLEKAATNQIWADLARNLTGSQSHD